jgi:hypothetical protein
VSEIDRFNQINKKIRSLQSSIDRNEGALEEKMKELADVYGCETLDEAKKLYRTLKRDRKAAEEAFDAAFDELDEESGDKIRQASKGRQ